MAYEDDENKLQLQEYNAMQRAARSFFLDIFLLFSIDCNKQPHTKKNGHKRLTKQKGIQEHHSIDWFQNR